MQFEHSQDKIFFAQLLAGGSINVLEQKYSELFDFRNPLIKRKEFNVIRPNLLKSLVEKYGHACQLHIHPECNSDGALEVDHIIPLSTNVLNKEIRHMQRIPPAKVPAQSFGSNNIQNMALACPKCNSRKKHRILGELTVKLLQSRF